MIIKAAQKYSRQSARKVRLVANQVKDLAIKDAVQQLALIERKSTEVLLKVLRQALANASHNHGLSMEDLKIKEIIINDGPIYKRFQAVSRGRAHNIFKRTCHVMVALETKDQVAVKPVETKAQTTASTEKVVEAPAAKKAVAKKDKAAPAAKVKTEKKTVKKSDKPTAKAKKAPAEKK